jgi:hypothetical protein
MVRLVDDVTALVAEVSAIGERGPIDRAGLAKACLDEGLLDNLIKFEVCLRPRKGSNNKFE